jgi:transketolase
MSLPDMAYFRSYTHADDGRGNRAATVFHPADAVAAYRLTAMAANTPNLVYVRTHRPDVALLYGQDETFEIGGCKQLVEGDKLTIVASGYMVTVALQAVRELEKAGVKCNLFDAYCLPMNCAPIFAAAKKANGTVLVVEDNFVGGVYSEVAESAAQAGEVRVEAMTCPRIPKSGKTGDIILAALGLGSADIVAQAKALAG